jgi:hypothetical protein
VSVEVGPALAVRAEQSAGTADGSGTTEARSGPSRAFDALWIVGLLAVIGVAIPVAVASRYGALGIPRSDDWSYLLTMYRWLEDGKLTFNGWVSMTLMGQVLIAAPIAAIFGRNITLIQLLTAMMGLVGLLGVVWIGRQVVRPVWWAVFVAATIAVGPLWGPLAPTFMTDVPAFTFQMLSLAAAIIAFRSRPVALRPLAISVALGFVGVSIRQYAVIPVIAILIVAALTLIATKDWRRLRGVAVIAGVFAFATLVLLVWWSGLPDSKSLSPTVPNLHLISGMLIKDAGFLRLTGLLLLPVVALAGPVAIVRRAWAASSRLTIGLTIIAGAWLAVMYARVPRTPFVGNYVAREGVLSTDVLAGNRPNVIPSSLFNLLVIVGSLAGIVIVLAAVPFLMDLPRRVRERDVAPQDPAAAVLGFVIAGFAAAYSIAITTGLPVYDRYALPVLPLVALLVLRSTRREPREVRSAPPRRIWAGVTIALLAVLGLTYTVDSASFDGTRWEVSQMATDAGYKSLQVGGGFEWLSYHRAHGPLYRWDFAKDRPVQLKRYTPPCVNVLINPARTSRHVVASANMTSLFHGTVRIVAVRNRRPCGDGKPTVPVRNR